MTAFWKFVTLKKFLWKRILKDASSDSEEVDKFTEEYVEEEEFKYRGCYFGGFPYYCQNDDNPGPEYKLIMSFDECDAFSLMWGDCGNAQLWLREDDSNQFYLTWACC